MVKFLALTDFQGLILYSSLVLTKISASSPKYRVLHQNNGFSTKICGGVFEQLARYTTRYQESDLHLAFILLNLLFSYFSLLTSSSIVAVLIAKAGHVWVNWPEEFLLYILSLTLLLLGNRLAYAQLQVISTKQRRSALTPQTRLPVKKLTSDNAKRITFLIWQQVNSRAKH